MEPIKIKATPVPVAKEIETETGIDSNADSDTETFEIAEPAATPDQRPAEPAQSGPRKKRRRASSSGIITPGSSPTS
jgi:hypothetical protein